MPYFRDVVQLYQGYTAITRRQFTSDWPQKGERLSRHWNHPMFLNSGPLDYLNCRVHWKKERLLSVYASSNNSIFVTILYEIVSKFCNPKEEYVIMNTTSQFLLINFKKNIKMNAT